MRSKNSSASALSSAATPAVPDVGRQPGTRQDGSPAPLTLVKGHTGPYHVSLDAVDEFERCIEQDPQVRAEALDTGIAATGAYYRWQARERLGVSARPAHRPSVKQSRAVDPGSLVILMGANFRKCFPACSTPGPKSIYLFDAWPDRHARIARFISDFGIDDVFVTASQARDAIAALVPEARLWWVPEGIDATDYRHREPAEKDIDVLALGRRHDRHHERIVDRLAAAGCSYRYELQKGQLVFATRDDFIDGLARTRISICVPSTVTHPDRAGGIETMTLRYLQSMVSKCLIVGHAPAEMIRLFGYNPVVEIDPIDPAGQLLSLLDHWDDQRDLIERNHAAVLASHTWPRRWQQMRQTLLQRPTSAAA